jgi:hypothetical protein
MIRAALTIAAALLVATPPTAVKREAPGVTQLRVAPARLDPAKAYLLVQSSRAKSGLFPVEHVLLRIPSEAELAAFRAARDEAYNARLAKLQKQAKGGPVPAVEEIPFDYKGASNAFGTKGGEFLVDGEMRTLLMEVPAGTYLLYGVALGSRALITCNCLGTVAFVAKPGVITNMGALYADKVHKESPVPNLEDNVGPDMFNYGFIMGQALVPATAASPVPAGLHDLPIELADYHAVGLFHEAGAPSINRLAPVPGVLRYDRGKVIDVKTDQKAR